jgi:hypothetical protein
VNREQILFFRNLFFRAFLVGFAFALFFFIATCAGWHTWVAWGGAFFKIGEKEFGSLVMLFFLVIRIVLVFFFLVPALALHWTARARRGESAGR